MIFLNAWAFGLLGLAGVITALYFLRRREERLTVSALWLWHKDQEHPRSALAFLWTKIWLLLVQLAALAALVFALAAPTLTQEFLSGGSFAVVIDGSASMQAQQHEHTRYERAVALALKIIERRRPSHLTVIQAQRAPRLLVPLTEHRADAVEALKSSRPTLQSDAKPSLLGELLRSQGASFDEIVYLSDRAPALTWEGVEWIPVGEPQKNIAITGFAARLLPESAQGVALWARIENFSSEKIEGTLKFFTEDTEIWSEPLHVEAHEGRSVEALSEKSIGGRFRAVLEVADDFVFDNVRYAVVPTRPKLKILWLGERNFFLERALGIFAEAVIEERSDIPSQDFSLVIAHNVELPSPPVGRFLLINSPVEPMVRLTESSVSSGTLQLLQPAHPIVQNVRLEHFQTASLRKAELAPSVPTLIASDGSPILAAYRSGSLSFVFLGTDLRASPLVLTPSFPIFVQNITRWLLPEVSLPTEQFVSEQFPIVGFTDGGAVNLDPIESQEVNVLPAPSLPEGEGSRGVRGRAQTLIWYYGAWGALGLLVIELFLYDRGLFRRKTKRESHEL